MKLFGTKTVREIMDFTEEEIEKVLAEGNWGIGSTWKESFNDLPENIQNVLPAKDILARAITYAWKKYPRKHREVGIFATCIEGFTTGMWGGFGQDQDPLMEDAQNAIITLAGGVPTTITQSVFTYSPPLDKNGNVQHLGGLLSPEEFTKAGIQLLENLCFKSKKQGIEDALEFLEQAIDKMEKSKSAFKSKLVAESRELVERAKKILENL